MPRYTHYNISLHRIFFLCILLLSNVIFIGATNAAVKMPNCASLNGWAAFSYTKDKNLQRNTFLRSKLLLNGFKDETMKKIFGKTLNQWSDADFLKLRKSALACDPILAQQIRAAQQKRNRNLISLLQGARGFTYGYLNMGNPTYYNMVITQQRQNYIGREKAEALVAKQTKQLKNMKPTVANIKKIAVMAKKTDLAYLTPFESKNHFTTLRVYGIKFAGDIVDNAANKFKSYPETIEGLRQLQAYRNELQKDLKNVEPYKWKTFNKALNDIALVALDDFEKELNVIPATSRDLPKVNYAIKKLFRYPVTGSIRKSYQQVANKRVAAIKQDLRKSTCYKSLDMMDLKSKHHDEPLLAYNGETTLGLFICDISRAGSKFQSYEGASLFGSTYTLNLLGRRGISLTIEMKKVEAVKGKKMLVGILVKDASSETKLTLSGWQDYAAKLVGRRPRY